MDLQNSFTAGKEISNKHHIQKSHHAATLLWESKSKYTSIYGDELSEII